MVGHWPLPVAGGARVVALRAVRQRVSQELFWMGGAAVFRYQKPAVDPSETLRSPEISERSTACLQMLSADAGDSAPQCWRGKMSGDLLGVLAEFLDGGSLPVIGAQHRTYVVQARGRLPTGVEERSGRRRAHADAQ